MENEREDDGVLTKMKERKKSRRDRELVEKHGEKDGVIDQANKGAQKKQRERRGRCLDVQCD